MKKIFLTTAALLILLSIIGYADFDYNKWKYYKSLEGKTIDKEGFGTFDLDEEILNSSYSDFRDLRVVDDKGNETQYKIISSQLKVEQEKRGAVIVKREFAPRHKGYSILILDTGEKRFPINQVDLEISDRNFLKKVDIQGSDELDIWKDISFDNQIYDISDKGIKDFSLVFESTKYRYLKFKIYDETKNQLSINSAQVWYNQKNNLTQRAGYENKLTRKEDKSKKETTIIMDLGYNNVPVISIEIETDDTNFNRSVTVSGGNDLKNLNYLGEDIIYNYSLENVNVGSTQLFFSEAPCRYIELIISNQDNQPLNIKKISAFGDKKRALFKVKPGAKYYAYYGGTYAQMPIYEIENVIPYIDSYKLPIFKLGGQSINDKYALTEAKEVKTDEKNYQLYLILIIASMCLVLAFVVARSFKKVTGEK